MLILFGFFTNDVIHAPVEPIKHWTNLVLFLEDMLRVD